MSATDRSSYNCYCVSVARGPRAPLYNSQSSTINMAKTDRLTRCDQLWVSSLSSIRRSPCRQQVCRSTRAQQP